MQPLALVVYENLLPGTQLANRLRDLGYRVQAVTEPARLIEVAQTDKPLVVLLDLASQRTDMCGVIRELKQHPDTAHLPVLAFSGTKNPRLQDDAHAAGATLVASVEALSVQLPMLLEQLLEVE
jgi:two-component system, cell cycle response regulator DivK